MMKRITAAATIVAATLVLAAVGLAAGTGSQRPAAQPAPLHMQASQATSAATASDVRALLGRLFGEHAALAMNATNQGVSGSPAFKATAASLDRNSVALSRAIGSVYGAKAAKTFLDGKFMWRDHVRFFVDYTVALAQKDKAKQNRAVANLQRYTVVFGDFLAGATGLPKLAVRNDLLGHVLELKKQLDEFAAGKYSPAAKTYAAAYAHMFVTADLVAGAIAKQKA